MDIKNSVFTDNNACFALLLNIYNIYGYRLTCLINKDVQLGYSVPVPYNRHFVRY